MLFSTMHAADLNRKTKLKELLQTRYRETGRAQFCKDVGLSASRVSQLLDPDEAFGERVARMALYWHTHHARYFVVNEARDEIAKYYRRAVLAELEIERLRRRVTYLDALQSRGSANDPAFQSA